MGMGMGMGMGTSDGVTYRNVNGMFADKRDNILNTPTECTMSRRQITKEYYLYSRKLEHTPRDPLMSSHKPYQQDTKGVCSMLNSPMNHPYSGNFVRDNSSHKTSRNKIKLIRVDPTSKSATQHSDWNRSKKYPFGVTNGDNVNQTTILKKSNFVQGNEHNWTSGAESGYNSKSSYSNNSDGVEKSIGYPIGSRVDVKGELYNTESYDSTLEPSNKAEDYDYDYDDYDEDADYDDDDDDNNNDNNVNIYPSNNHYFHKRPSVREQVRRHRKKGYITNKT